MEEELRLDTTSWYLGRSCSYQMDFDSLLRRVSLFRVFTVYGVHFKVGVNIDGLDAFEFTIRWKPTHDNLFYVSGGWLCMDWVALKEHLHTHIEQVLPTDLLNYISLRNTSFYAEWPNHRESVSFERLTMALSIPFREFEEFCSWAPRP